jgi:glycosyltransferase involved in cell wall biosynthesis
MALSELMAPDDRPLLSVCVITLNEAESIGRCLRSVHGLADEIVVVDSLSEDRTAAIARAAGARVVEQEFLGYVKQKQLALDLARGRWVLSLDADEWLDSTLREAIGDALSAPPPDDVSGFELKRRPYVLGRWIRHGGCSPEWKTRLARRERAHWTGFDPHDRLHVDGTIRRLPGTLCHHPYADLSAHADTINRYTSLIAGHWPRLSRLRLLLGIVAEPPLVLLHRFVVQRGFLDGRRGFILAVMSAHYFFLRYAKLWERDLKVTPPDADVEPTAGHLTSSSIRQARSTPPPGRRG